MNNIYDEINNGIECEKTEDKVKRRTDLKIIYSNFLNDFREYLTEFIKETAFDLVISEIPVNTTPVRIFEELCSGRFVTLKNQGQIACYLTTGNQGGFRLEAGEKEKFWVNRPVTLVTISGNTSLGIIRS